LPGETNHSVACLLEPEVRMKIWEGLQAGTDQGVLRKLAGSTPLAPDALLDSVPITEASDATTMSSESDVAGQPGGGV
jgi:hypothetical protein